LRASSAWCEMGEAVVEAHTHSHPDNPVVFFDVSIGGVDAGRIKMELFKDIVPLTAENFRCDCSVCCCRLRRLVSASGPSA
jgi:peptidyl-prolyl isomerase H (cyclophilin H)